MIGEENLIFARPVVSPYKEGLEIRGNLRGYAFGVAKILF
jgi:hypothetical protein